MLEAFATIGALALVFGAVFSLYFGLRRVIRPRPADNAGATLAGMTEWAPTVPNRDDHKLHGLER